MKVSFRPRSSERMQYLRAFAEVAGETTGRWMMTFIQNIVTNLCEGSSEGPDEWAERIHKD